MTPRLGMEVVEVTNCRALAFFFSRPWNAKDFMFFVRVLYPRVKDPIIEVPMYVRLSPDCMSGMLWISDSFGFGYGYPYPYRCNFTENVFYMMQKIQKSFGQVVCNYGQYSLC